MVQINKMQLSGNVGIGTTNPNHDLEIVDDVSTVLINGTSNNAVLYLRSFNGNNAVISLGDEDGERVVLDAYGNSFITSGNSGADNFGIGDTSPDYRLDVEENAASSPAAYFFNDGNNANRFGVFIQAGADDAAGTNTAIRFDDGDGTTQGDITFSSGTVSYNAFTASHNAILPISDNLLGYPYGTLVCTISIYLKENSGIISERGIEYNVQKCSKPYSKNVLGAYAGKYEDKENIHQVYVLGDGHILVNGEGGNIQIGDPITTSSTEGIGMKAAKPGIIIGIAQENIDFSNSEPKLVAVQYGVSYYVPEDLWNRMERLEKLESREIT